MAEKHATVLIIGGGAAGVSVANNMRRQNADIDITIVEPSDKHYYQPGFTIVGGGAYTLEKATRNEADLIGPGIEWIRDHAETFDPENFKVALRSGDVISYDFLVVCPGLQLDWNKVDGLKEALNNHGVCSNYSPDTVEYTWECIRGLRSGTALFTQPPMPIKCAGAPQKIMYLAADRFRRNGNLKMYHIEFCNAGPGMFGVPFFAKALAQVAAEYGIKTSFGHNLVAIDGPGKVATFEISDADGNKQRVDKKFDMIHVTPPQSAPDFIKRSPLAAASGWVDVNEKTLQHNKYPNIFGLGDATTTPNAKTAAAVRKQVPIVVDNILNQRAGRPVEAKYDGYGSCPLTTSLSGVMLAEFGYGGKVIPSFPVLDPRKSRYIWWIGKTHGFPWLYWQIMLKGRRLDLPSRESYASKLVEAG